MARERKAARRIAAARPTDEELIAKLQDEAPDALKASIPEAIFDLAVTGLLKESPTEEPPHFYCRKCHEYHLKTHEHYIHRK